MTNERTETHACDSISRRAAIKAIDKFNVCGYVEEPWEKLRDALQDLPAAQPEIVRCKDCKWVEHYGIDGNASYWCKNWDGGTDADGFCYEAERRTDENNNE